MDEYIEREALIAEYDRVHVGAAGGARKLIKDFPAADVVEVVRCKDCKSGEVDDPDFPEQFYCHEGCGWNNADFFCAYGARRGKE